MSTKTQTLTQEEILASATMADIENIAKRSPRPMRHAISKGFSMLGRAFDIGDSLLEIGQYAIVPIKSDMRREALESLTNKLTDK